VKKRKAMIDLSVTWVPALDDFAQQASIRGLHKNKLANKQKGCKV